VVFTTFQLRKVPKAFHLPLLNMYLPVYIVQPKTKTQLARALKLMSGDPTIRYSICHSEKKGARNCSEHAFLHHDDWTGYLLLYF
jgi:hypothetical protein